MRHERLLLVLLCLSSMTYCSRSFVKALAAKTSSFCDRSSGVRVSPYRGGRRASYSTRALITMMPEGPEVRTLVDQLQGGVGMRLCDISFLSGRYVRHGKPDGFDGFAKTMTLCSDASPTASVDMIREWNVKGKFIYIILDDGNNRFSDGDFQRSIWITLGMSGRFLSQAAHETNPAHARWYLELLDVNTRQRRKIYYHDSRNFGTLKFCLSQTALADKLSKLGPDILNTEATTEEVFVALVSKQKPELNVCKFLLNQSKLAGIGNYILSESLYRASIDPFCSVSELTTDQQRSLFREIQSIALESYKAQGLTRKGGTFRGVDGTRGQFQFELQCYGRNVCAKGKPVIKETDGPHGRAIWYVEDQLFLPRILRKGDASPINKEDANTESKNRGYQSDDATADAAPAVERLVAGLKEPTWKSALSNTFHSESFQDLAMFLESERVGGKTVYPPENEIFSALNLCPLDQVKVVIIGQDPYHGGQAHGLSFSVRRGVSPPASLKNIFREAMADVGIPNPPHGNLEYWAKQGVLMINAVLTVRRGQANSHASVGWEEVTDEIVAALDKGPRSLVFLLWGNPSQKKGSRVDESKHCIIRTSHPSPLGAAKTKSPFLGSKCFSRANVALQKFGQDPIDWSVR